MTIGRVLRPLISIAVSPDSPFPSLSSWWLIARCWAKSFVSLTKHKNTSSLLSRRLKFLFAFNIRQSAETPTNNRRQQESSHRRTESCSADSSRNNLPVPSSIPPPLVSPSVQSPRERSRIRTNPWLSANSSGSSTNGLKSRQVLDESSSSSGLKLTESSGSASDVNLNGREPRGGKEGHRQESLSAGRSP